MDSSKYPLSRHFCGEQPNARCSIKRTETNWIMVRHGDTLARRSFCLQNDVAALLIHLDITPMLAENFCQISASKVAGKLHATAKTSSRTRWSRMAEGIFPG
jgi:hypothetical protein